MATQGLSTKPQNEGKARGTGNVVTGETLENNTTAIHVLDKSRATSVATDVIDSIAGNVITAAAHVARAADLIRMTSGAASGVEFRVFATDTNTITLETDNPTLVPVATDTFEILRGITQTLTSTGGITAVSTFIRDGVNQEVTEDTGTPSLNRPLPVKLTDFSGDMILNASNLNLEVQLDHDSGTPDSVQIGDGTETANVSSSNELQVRDDDANTDLDTIAGDTTSLDAKQPALGAALTAASIPVNIASDQTVPVSAASLPLPSGAATEATLATVAGAVSGTEMQVDVLTSALPSGASTSALQTSSEAILTTIDTDTSALAGTVSGTELQVDIVTSALPAGASTSALQTSSEAILTTIDADTGTIAGAVSGTEMQVDVLTSALPSGAATSALQTSSEAILTTIDADTSSLAGTVSGSELQVDIVAALPAGGNTIGAVTIGALAVVDLIDDLGDGAGILFLANDSIDDSAGTFREIVASTAAEIKEIEIRSTAGGFVGLFTGPGASEVLLTTFGPGEDMAIQVGAITASTRLSLRRMDSATVPLTAGFITMNFLG